MLAAMRPRCVVDRQVRRLQSMSNGLRHAAVCRAPSHAECPSFQKLLRADWETMGAVVKASGAKID